jgi:UDP-N-acetyl-D-galactosamine dehydrogenase
MSRGRKIAVVGLGYVGLPVAVAFARGGEPVVGFDVDHARVEALRAGQDRTREVASEDLKIPSLSFTSDPASIRDSDFFIVTVPTPIDDARRPDLGALFEASRLVGAALKNGDIVVYESTVYPGAIEEECIPILEHGSGLKSGRDFNVGYSPERINPGDRTRRFETVTKIVSAQNSETLDIVADVYGSVVAAGIHRAPSIKVAEAAKVIENTQRDLNIALVNELSLIFQALGIDTGDVLEAARTKWNFLPFQPGLVGGHCVGVDPYYLTYRAEKAGYHPQVILAGRRINDDMGRRIAYECIRGLSRLDEPGRLVTILGITFKENVPDIRNSRVVDLVREIRAFGVDVQVADPLADRTLVENEYGLRLTDLDSLRPADAIVLAVGHDEFTAGGWPLMSRLLRNGRGIVFDVKLKLDRKGRPDAVELWRP